MKTLAIVTILMLIMPLSLVMGQPAQCTPTGPASTQLCNPLQVGNVKDLMTKVIGSVGTIIGMLAVMMIIYSGFRMLISQGNPEAIKTAKSGLTYGLVGLVVASLAFVIVIAAQNFIGIDPSGPAATGFRNPLQDASFQALLRTIVSNFLAFAGILAILMIIWNAFRYIIAAGNEEAVKTAKSGLLWSVLGFVTILISWALIRITASLLGI
jgi:hypothetical protein